MKNKIKWQFIKMTAIIAMALITSLSMVTCDSDKVGDGGKIATIISVTANGSSTQTTTELTLSFDKTIDKLSADDIILSGMPGLSKGTLSGSNPYTLPISGFTSDGTLSVAVTKSGYIINGSPKTVDIYYLDDNGGDNDIIVAFNSLTANGSLTQTTTQLTLTFDKDIDGLTEDDITLDVGFTGAIKGNLTRTDMGVYELAVSDINANGNMTVTVSKHGYDITDGPKMVAVYYAAPVAAETPILSVLTSKNYAKGANADPLSITARVSEGSLSYQWYKNTNFSALGSTPIDNAEGDSYTPSTAEVGDTYYYVIVTNTDVNKDIPASAISNIARIRVTNDGGIGTPAATITVNTAVRNQYIRGFGGMSNVWTSPALKMEEIDTLFNPEGLGLNIFRICIYPYMDDLFNGIEPGPSDNPDAHKDYYNMVRQAKKHGALILASPWTPPAEWKTNGSLSGGSLMKEHWGDYAQHLKDYIKRMSDNNAAIDYISTQNEPDFALSYGGCEWTGEEMRDFVKQYGRYIAPADGGVKLMPGESYQFRDAFYDPMYNDSAAMAAIDVIAGHIFGAGLRRHTKAINAGKEVWMTEHNINSGYGLYERDYQWQRVWVFIKEIHDCMVNDFNTYIWFYLKRFYSFIGDGSEYGTIEGKPLFRGYAMSHYAKYATGKTRVDANLNMTEGTNSDVFVTAYESDKEITLVLFNQGDTDVGQLYITLPVAVKGASMVITQGGSDTQNDTTAYGVKVMAPEVIVLSTDGKTGILDLPASSIISVRFTK